MALLVQKFGGTSLGSPERIRAVAKRIAGAQSRGNRVVVVVSAMGHTTDELIGLAHQVSEDPPHREMDMLLTAGERISMALVSMALADLGVAAVSFTGSQSGIITDSSHRRARIQRILGDRVREALHANKIAIVAGFQGVSENKEVTTLGRGGSDTTAVALAAALQADLCEIYTDVDGVYSADPRLVPGARLWKTLPLSLMVEMATRGAGVLHPRSVELAQQYGVALCVRNSLNDHEGTSFVVNCGVHLEVKGLEDFQITCVTGDSSQIFIEIELARPTVAAAVWDRASQDHLSVLTPVFSQNRLEFFGEREALNDWNRHLSDLAAQGFIVGYRIHDELSPLSVVGHRLTQDGAALHEIMGVLAREQIGVTSAAASALAVTLSVSSLKLDDAVRVLHQHFLEN